MAVRWVTAIHLLDGEMAGHNRQQPSRRPRHAHGWLRACRPHQPRGKAAVGYQLFTVFFLLELFPLFPPSSYEPQLWQLVKVARVV